VARGLAVVVLLTLVVGISAAWSQTTGASSAAVVVGQNAQGQNLVLRVIPLKFLDASVVAQLFGGGVVAGGSLGFVGGQGMDVQSGYTRRNHNPYERSRNNSNRDNSQGVGYQSSYGQRY